MHVHLYINGSSIMLNDAYPEHGHPSQAPQGFSLVIVTDDIDAEWQRAVDAGATIVMPVTEMFWGDRFGQLAIHGGDFVLGLRHQPLIDPGDAVRERALQPDHHDIEIVERADRDLAHGAALRCIRIDVVEALEVGGVFDVAEQRQRMPPRRFGLRVRRGNIAQACHLAQHRGPGAKGRAL